MQEPARRPDLRAAAGRVEGPAIALALLLLPPPESMPPDAWRTVAVAAWTVVWWMTEAIPLPATALLPLVLLPLCGVAEIRATAAQYAHPLIFLFLGGFLLAAATRRVRLHRRVALAIVRRVGTSPSRTILGFMLATAFLSMWISNTATAILMYAVGLSVIEVAARDGDRDGDGDGDADAGGAPAPVRRFGVALMLAIAYSASIGGVATLIGTPPNALLAGFLDSAYGLRIGFAEWMLFGVPLAATMLLLAWLLLTRVLHPAGKIALGGAERVVAREAAALGRLAPGERRVGRVFLAAAAGWIFRAPLARATGLPLDDTLVALAAALALFLLPTGAAPGERALDARSLRDVPWGVLLLFGGGLALAGGFQESGLAAWIGDAVGGLAVPAPVLVLAVVAAMVFLTEITSNTASTATFLPILGAVAVGLALDPRTLCVPAAVAASMAFMMPVATPPNAIVFAWDGLELRDMVRAGFLLNLAAIATIFLLFATLGRVALGGT